MSANLQYASSLIVSRTLVMIQFKGVFKVLQETAKSTFKNGILEIVFDKMKESKPKGKDIKIE